jgi:hypothetical protein
VVINPIPTKEHTMKIIRTQSTTSQDSEIKPSRRTREFKYNTSGRTAGYQVNQGFSCYGQMVRSVR